VTTQLEPVLTGKREIDEGDVGSVQFGQVDRVASVG